MAKLYFRYGTVASAKTLNLLAVSHNYRQQDKKILLFKPKFDDRFDKQLIKSRAGLSADADFLLCDNSVFKWGGRFLGPTKDLVEPQVINLDLYAPLSCLIVDEIQFLSKGLVEQLFQLTVVSDIPVICYGLKTNFRGELFAASKRLLELAETLEELKTVCHYCHRKATFNLKILDGMPNFSGPEMQLGAEELYLPTCKYCYTQRSNELKS